MIPFLPLDDVTPVLFLHRIAELVSPPNFIHLGRAYAGKNRCLEQGLEKAETNVFIRLYYMLDYNNVIIWIVLKIVEIISHANYTP